MKQFRQVAFQNDYQKAINDVTYLVMDAFIQHLINLGLATIQEEQLVASDQRSLSHPKADQPGTGIWK